MFPEQEEYRILPRSSGGMESCLSDMILSCEVLGGRLEGFSPGDKHMSAETVSSLRGSTCVIGSGDSGDLSFKHKQDKRLDDIMYLILSQTTPWLLNIFDKKPSNSSITL